MHAMAKTYGKLPSELLSLTWAEYQFNAAVLLAGLERDDGHGAADGPVSWDWSDLV